MILNLVFILLGLIAAAVVGGFLFETISSIRDRQRYKTPAGERVSVNDHALHIVKRGEREAGKPAIVLEARIGSGWLDWQRVVPQLAEFAQVIAYDRAGYGWSDQGDAPRSTAVLVNDLHALLHEANIEPPYLLVGHSFGGLHVRAFAERFPEESAGMVLIESSHPRMLMKNDREAELKRLRNVQWFKRIGLVRVMLARILTHASYLSESDAAQYRAMYLLDTANTLHEAKPLFTEGITLDEKVSIPLVVISRQEDDDLASEEKWADYQRDLARLHPQAKHIHADTSSHFIMIAEPETVVKAVRELYERL